MAGGKVRPEGMEACRIETAAGIEKYDAVKAGAAVDGVLLGDATHAFYGVCDKTQLTQNGVTTIQTDGVAQFRAHEAIGRLTGGNPTAVYMAAAGRVMLLPAAAGTYYRVGFMHISSPDAAAQDDLVTVTIDRATVVVPSAAFAGYSTIPFVLPADLADSAAYEAFLLLVPAGLVFTIARLDIWNTNAVLATVDPEIDGTDILASPQALGDGVVTSITSFTDATVAAGEVLSLEFVTGASTGALDGCQGVVVGTFSAA